MRYEKPLVFLCFQLGTELVIVMPLSARCKKPAGNIHYFKGRFIRPFFIARAFLKYIVIAG